MKFRRLGQCGLQVSTVSIGAWLTYGGSVEEAAAARILHEAVALGVNFIDVADVYARGQAEVAVGKALKDMRRSDVVLSTKVYWPMSEGVNDRGLSRKHIFESIHASLKRLGTDYVDLYFCHRMDEHTPIEETIRAMDDLVHQGKVLYWGTSVWTARALMDSHNFCHSHNLYRPQVEQPRYNMFHRDIEADVLPTSARLGMGVVVWSPLAQGLLTGKYNQGVPEGSRAATTGWLREDLTEANLHKVKLLARVAADHSLTVGQLALAWCLRRPELTSTIIGATQVEQLRENVAASDITLSDETLQVIEGILRG